VTHYAGVGLGELGRSPSRTHRVVDPDALTPGELRALRLYADPAGLGTAADVARRLGLREYTAKTYLRNACAKLGVSRPAQAMVVLSRRGVDLEVAA
jgi:DNA-binding CsgD family transcriptional regulator